MGFFKRLWIGLLVLCILPAIASSNQFHSSQESWAAFAAILLIPPTLLVGLLRGGIWVFTGR